MKTNATIDFGKYKGTLIHEIPIDYLVWLFPLLTYDLNKRNTIKDILIHFLSRNVRVEEHKNNKTSSKEYHFYFNDYMLPDLIYGERPFIKSYSRMVNSRNQYVYEVGHKKYPMFIEQKKSKFKVSDDYISISYRFAGATMVYEKNPEYYFFDNYGRIMMGAYLMREPFLPQNYFNAKFSENLLIKNLEIKNK